MICPKCGYEQAIYDDINEWWHCPQCHGSGECQMTNEEYLHSLNTEQLAELMSRMVGCSICPIPKYGRSCKGTYSGCWHEIIKWLKQPHSEVGK